MNTKNYFIASAVLNLLFGFSLVFLPGMMTDQYLTDPATRTTASDMISRLFGIALMSLAVGGLMVRNSPSSTARNAWIVSAIIAQVGFVIVHVMAINQAVEKPFAWGTVGISVVMFIWGVTVWRKKE